jgi:hypothetical protein
MNDFWNFKDTLEVAQSNLMWLILALIIGLIVGWVTCVRRDDRTAGGE